MANDPLEQEDVLAQPVEPAEPLAAPATPEPANPITTPQSVGADEGGRPPEPAKVGSAAEPVAAEAPKTPSAAMPTGAPAGTQPVPQWQGQQGWQAPGTEQAPAPPGVRPIEVAPEVQHWARVPYDHELRDLPPNVTVETPWGTVQMAPDGKRYLVPNESGRQKLAEKHQAAVRAFGYRPFADDPAAPPPPINPNGRNFNPFDPDWSAFNK